MKAKVVINERDYVIQLEKKDFNIDFLADFISRIQREEAFFFANNHVDDIKSKSENYERSNRFDHLDEK